MAPTHVDPLREALTTALGAQYDVIRLIGSGGMGAVYLGRERLLDRQVAIKVLPHESADTEDARERFLREARTAARLSHPNVVPLYSFGEAGKTLFYIMGYVEGESLEQRLQRDVHVSFEETQRILGELAAALEHAHAHGVIHRDVKPDNVLLESGTGRVVLTDFGIAKQLLSGRTLTRTGMTIGTPQYMSPEQAQGSQEVDGRTDIYSLGIIGYRMLAGRLPFEGGSLQELVHAQLTREPPSLSAIVQGVPPDLESAVTRCLAKEPGRRWPSAALLREALGRGDIEVRLPDALAKLPGSASSAAIAIYLGLIASLSAYYLTRDGSWLVAVVGGPIVVVVVTVRSLLRGRDHGISGRRLLQLAFWPPRWWKLWWPGVLRRPGDVWLQLPDDIRRLRSISSAAIITGTAVFLPALLVGTLFKGILPQAVTTSMALVGLAGLIAGSVAVFWAPVHGRRWGEKYQLSATDVEMLRSQPTWWSHFWTRPDIARLLNAQKRAPLGDPAPVTPAQVVAALEKLVPVVSEPLRPLILESVAAARETARWIAIVDDELRVLARDDDPAENERLQQRLAALGTARPDEPASFRQMRSMASGQLALRGQLERRGQELSSRRARYTDLLLTLWPASASLRTQDVDDTMAVSDVSGRIRALCRSVEHLVANDRERVAATDADLDTPTSPFAM